QDTGNSSTRTHCEPDRTGAMDLQQPGGEIGGHAVERTRTVFDLLLAEVSAKQTGRFSPSRQGDQWDRVVADRIRVREGSAYVFGEYLIVPFERGARGDDRAHAGTAEKVDLDSRFAQRTNHPDVCKAARAATGQYKANRPPRDHSGESSKVAWHILANVMMLAYIEERQQSEGLRRRNRPLITIQNQLD